VRILELSNHPAAVRREELERLDRERTEQWEASYRRFEEEREGSRS
jgi:hypothetical protein